MTGNSLRAPALPAPAAATATSATSATTATTAAATTAIAAATAFQAGAGAGDRIIGLMALVAGWSRNLHRNLRIGG
jgi:hypothetical protein